MSRLFLALALATLLTACSLIGAPASPTAAPTRLAAVTPPPTARATAVATETPGATPTVKASETVTAEAPSAVTEAFMNGVANKVAAARGLALKAKVPVTVMARDQVRPYLMRKLEEDNEKEDIEKSKPVLVLMGLLKEEDDIYDLWLQLHSDLSSGFYDLEARQMMLVGVSNPPSLANERTIAHEYTHALQDQNFDLGAKLKRAKGKGEQSSALRALCEGDAQLSALEYMRQNKTAVQLADLQMQSSGASREKLLAVPFALRVEQSFTYDNGFTFARNLTYSKGWAALDKAYANPPQTSEQIIHPEKFEAGEGARKVTLPEIAPTLGAQWSAVQEDTKGELFWYEFLAPYVSANESWDAITGWGGDRYVLLKNAEGKYALAALTIWDAADEARQFHAATLSALSDPARDLKITSVRNSHTLWSAQGLSGYVSLKNDQVLFVVSPDLNTTKKIVALFAGFPTP